MKSMTNSNRPAPTKESVLQMLASLTPATRIVVLKQAQELKQTQKDEMGKQYNPRKSHKHQYKAFKASQPAPSEKA